VYYILLTTCLLGVLYLGYSIVSTYLWRSGISNTSEVATLRRLSIIILARDEEDHIERALKSIQACEYPKELYEVILMDDHSTDQTVQKAKQLSDPQLRILHLQDYNLDRFGQAYKKAGLYYAVREARHPFILQIDADCTCRPGWMQTMQGSFESADVVIGPIDISSKKSNLLHLWQTYESMGTMISTYVGQRLDLWYSGASANMGYHKDVFNAYIKDHDLTLASGDDVFMIQDAVSKDRKVSFAFDRRAIINTQPLNAVKPLFAQRLRWASKTKYYKANGLKLFMGVMAAFHGLLVVSIVIGLITLGSNSAYLLLLALGCKWMGDWLILGRGLPFFGRRYRLLLSPIMSTAHTLYVTVIGVFGLRSTKYSWKGRQVR